MAYGHIVEPGSRVDLGRIETSAPQGIGKDEAKAKTKALGEEIQELQELLFATRDTALLCVFQGMDTAGKDGAINTIIRYVNVQSCRVASFKVPTDEELSHDFLWRIHKQTPGKGGMTIFNRSHYEDVLVVRVHDLAPKEVWSKRYAAINEFERNLSASGTTILKFFLHISKEEQEQRLLDREKDPLKSWKLNVGDWKERELWSQYQEAYEEALTRCSTEWAPWRIVPADQKWFRDLAVAEALAETLRPHRKRWEESLEKLGARACAELELYRGQTR